HPDRAPGRPREPRAALRHRRGGGRALPSLGHGRGERPGLRVPRAQADAAGDVAGPQEMELKPAEPRDRAGLLVLALGFTFLCHGAAMLGMVLFLLPGMPGGGVGDVMARAAYVAGHP